VLVEMWTAPRGENAHQALRAERDCSQRVVIGKRGQHYVAFGEVGQSLGSAGAGQGACPLRVPVIDEHLMTVFDKIDGKSVSHMAETDHTDTSDNEALQIMGHVDLLSDSVPEAVGRSQLAARKALPPSALIS
jgi:hypothetical protein